MVATSWTVEAIEELATQWRYERELIDDKRNAFLRANGWKYTCDTPGSVWMWEKTISDGRTVLVGPELAVAFEQSMAEYALRCENCDDVINEDGDHRVIGETHFCSNECALEWERDE